MPPRKAKPVATKRPVRVRPHAREEHGEAALLAEQLRAVRAIGAALASAVGLEALLRAIVPHVSKLMRAERSTLFVLDPATGEIWSKVAEGSELREIRLRRGEGIAGWAAEHRQTVNVADAYQDARFNPNIDAQSGFRTHSVAAAPLVNRQGELIGVLQVLNHKGGPFGDEEIGLLDAIAAQTAYAVENARQAEQILHQNRELEAARQRAERRRAELDLLYELERDTAASYDLDQMLDSVIGRVCERLRSEAGSVLIADRDSGRLFFRAVRGERKDERRTMTLSLGEGIVGWVAKTGEPLVVNRPDDDPRHNRHIARALAFPAQAILAVPLVWDQRVIGAVEVLNPRPRASGAVGYDLEDVKVLTLIAGQLARAVAVARDRQARIDNERLVLIGRMLASVAHDLRNPMTAISGYAQLMVNDGEEGVREERCERILSQIDEMTAMITDLLAFARGDTRLHPASLEVAKLARDAEHHLRSQCAPRGIELVCLANGGTAVIDVGRAKRILFNLAKNAIDVLNHGDTLTIEIREQAGGLRLRVSDTGPGIPEEVRARLFEPFVTAGKVNGTGLGLSIVKRFVDDHGGSIEVETATGAGTTIVAHLPQVAPEGPGDSP